MVLVDGLVQAIKDGNRINGDEAFPRWCKSVWVWFATKYGNRCLNKCMKTQCVPVCQWMKKRNRLDDVDINVYEKELRLEKDKKELAKDRHDLKLKEKTLSKRERAEVKAISNKVYARRALDFAADRLGNATALSRNASKKLAKFEDMIK